MKGLLVIAVLSLLGGCAANQAVVRDRPVTVNVPVPQPCVGTRPDKVVAVRDQMTPEQLAALDVRQKAALVGEAGLDRKTYGEQLDAATASCP